MVEGMRGYFGGVEEWKCKSSRINKEEKRGK